MIPAAAVRDFQLTRVAPGFLDDSMAALTTKNGYLAGYDAANPPATLPANITSVDSTFSYFRDPVTPTVSGVRYFAIYDDYAVYQSLTASCGGDGTRPLPNGCADGVVLQ